MVADMPLHPELPTRRVLDSRRKPAGSGPLPVRNPRQHGGGLRRQLDAIRQTRSIPIAIDPNLVFKVKASNTRVNDEALVSRGLIPLGETVDYRYFVMASDEGENLATALERYAGGEDREGAHGPLYTLFDRVEAIEPYGPDDRRGPGLEANPARTDSVDRQRQVAVGVLVALASLAPLIWRRPSSARISSATRLVSGGWSVRVEVT